MEAELMTQSGEEIPKIGTATSSQFRFIEWLKK